MSVFALEAGSGWLARRNPAAKIVAATVLAVVLVASLDLVTPTLVLAATLLALPLLGVPGRLLLRRTAPLVITAVTVGAVNAAFGRTSSGATWVELGPVEVTSGSARTGLAIGLRVLALGLPAVLALLGTDPVDLADSLVQQWHAPPKFAYGALAALRLLPLLGDQWHTLARARRARGIDAGGDPVARLRQFGGQVLALLVGAIRRGTRLAAAMDARGFDSGAERTFARRQRVLAPDRLLVACCLVVAVGAVVTSVLLGTWRPLVGG